MFERILIPLDGSPRAELILFPVARILRREDSDVLLLRVTDPLPKAKEEAEKYIQDLERRLTERGVKVRGRVVEGSVASGILDIARQESSTMIAMTTHGRGGLARWAMGSVAEKVARASEVPILLVRSFPEAPLGNASPEPAQELPFRRILVPVDGSLTSMAVVEAAGEFARVFESEVLVLHVWPPTLAPLYVAPGVPIYRTDPGALFPIPSPEKDEMTAPAAERFRRAGLRVTRVTASGDPAAEILDQAQAKGADLVALGTHGRSGVSRWVLGSVAERVLRHSGTHILLVRASPPDRRQDPDRGH